MCVRKRANTLLFPSVQPIFVKVCEPFIQPEFGKMHRWYCFCVCACTSVCVSCVFGVIVNAFFCLCVGRVYAGIFWCVCESVCWLSCVSASVYD